MRTAAKNIFLKMILDILSIIIYHFLPEGIKINKYQKLICNLYDKKVCHTHKSPKTSTKLSITTKKSVQSG